MKTLKDILTEGILDDIETTLSISDDDAKKSLNGVIPTIKDFETNPFNRKQHAVSWHCPGLLNSYRSKYPDIIDDYTTIQLVLQTLPRNRANCTLKFTIKPSVVAEYEHIKGWGDELTGSNIRNYKKMAIEIITKIANDHGKLEEILKHTKQYRKEWEEWLASDSLVDNRLLKKKSLLDL